MGQAILFRGALALLVLAAGFFVYAFLPGRIEGNYSDWDMKCICGGASFMRYQDGKGIYYNTVHDTADLFYRYEREADGSVSVYSLSTLPDEEESLEWRADPRRLLTRFADPETGEAVWCWKRPDTGERGRVLATLGFERTQWTSNEEVTMTYFSPDHEEVRTEHLTKEELRSRKMEAARDAEPTGE